MISQKLMRILKFVLIPKEDEKSAFEAARKSPRFNDRKASCINLIQRAFRSLNPGFLARFKSRFFIFLGYILMTHFAFAETAFRSGTDSLPKVLVLIIASDDKTYYVEEQNIWRSYMHLDPKHVEAYFIKGSPNLEEPYSVIEDEIWSKNIENYIPGILNKTLLSMEALLPRLDEFDYVLRTNLSSFYYFPKLLEFLKELPPTECYSAVVGNYNGKFGSGAGIIFSSDLVKLMVDHKAELIDHPLPDDVAIGRFLLQRNIGIIPAKRLDFPSYKAFVKHRNEKLSKHYHFRLKHDKEHLRYTEEIDLQKLFREMFYGVQQELP